jgi:hypothetical protein
VAEQRLTRVDDIREISLEHLVLRMANLLL